jgi:ribosomal protein S18 acetylase RimI-like enzyme
VEIRPATGDDAAGIARVQVETWRDAYAGLVASTVLDSLSVPAGAARWASLLEQPDVGTHVAVVDGEVRGFVCAGGARDADASARAGEVYAIYVLPSAQRRGLGAALLDAAVSGMLVRGCDTFLLWVLTGNAAGRAFYESRGWAWDGSERRIDVGGGVVPEVRYALAATSGGLAR